MDDEDYENEHDSNGLDLEELDFNDCASEEHAKINNSDSEDGEVYDMDEVRKELESLSAELQCKLTDVSSRERQVLQREKAVECLEQQLQLEKRALRDELYQMQRKQVEVLQQEKNLEEDMVLLKRRYECKFKDDLEYERSKLDAIKLDLEGRLMSEKVKNKQLSKTLKQANRDRMRNRTQIDHLKNMLQSKEAGLVRLEEDLENIKTRLKIQQRKHEKEKKKLVHFVDELKHEKTNSELGSSYAPLNDSNMDVHLAEHDMKVKSNSSLCISADGKFDNTYLMSALSKTAAFEKHYILALDGLIQLYTCKNAQEKLSKGASGESVHSYETARKIIPALCHALTSPTFADDELIQERLLGIAWQCVRQLAKVFQKDTKNTGQPTVGANVKANIGSHLVNRLINTIMSTSSSNTGIRNTIEKLSRQDNGSMHEDVNTDVAEIRHGSTILPDFEPGDMSSVSCNTRPILKKKKRGLHTDLFYSKHSKIRTISCMILIDAHMVVPSEPHRLVESLQALTSNPCCRETIVNADGFVGLIHILGYASLPAWRVCVKHAVCTLLCLLEDGPHLARFQREVLSTPGFAKLFCDTLQLLMKVFDSIMKIDFYDSTAELVIEIASFFVMVIERALRKDVGTHKIKRLFSGCDVNGKLSGCIRVIESRFSEPKGGKRREDSISEANKENSDKYDDCRFFILNANVVLKALT